MPPPPTETSAALPASVVMGAGTVVPLQQVMFPAAVRAHALLACPCPATLATPEDTLVAGLELPPPAFPAAEPSPGEPELAVEPPSDGPASPAPVPAGQSPGQEANVSPSSQIPSPQLTGQSVRQLI